MPWPDYIYFFLGTATESTLFVPPATLTSLFRLESQVLPGS